jgi:hypothetical protein
MLAAGHTYFRLKHGIKPAGFLRNNLAFFLATVTPQIAPSQQRVVVNDTGGSNLSY